MMSAAVIAELRKAGDPRRAASQRDYFRTDPGGHGEGDRFLGLKVPRVREIARRYRQMTEDDLKELLCSPWHEARMVAALLLAERAKKVKTAKESAALARFYWRHRAGINNWDLVDISAPPVLGRWLALQNDAVGRKWLLTTAGRKNLWERRMAVMATFSLLRAGRTRPTFAVCRSLLNDSEDLIHKAAGWMLREAGQRDPGGLDRFLTKYAARMPRTMLRYAIEKKSASERKRWLQVKASRTL